MNAVALITGGGTGIGRATAIALAARGHDLAICGRRPAPLAETAAVIGPGCLPITCDVREPAQVDGMLDAVLERFGRIDVLVNNAGGQFVANAEDISLKGFRAVHRLAVDASWDVTQKVATRSLIPNRGGVVIFIGFSPRTQVGYLHASAARAAVENLAAGLSNEWSRYGIRSLCVAVGNVLSDGAVEAYGEDVVESWRAAMPIGRLGRPADVAEVIAFLTSDAGSFMTGSTVFVDGGQSAWGAAAPPPPRERSDR